MNDENVVERVCLLALMKKEADETLSDVQKMLVETGMFDMKECKTVFKMLKSEQYISEDGGLTMKGVMEAKLAEEMFKQ
ncbi:MAG: hypothetical protein B6D54_02405 [Epsilonproteobacteria bacterium 4484_65]|nr:MAG: hypothetical protein B6D54_02405 [Epsilonproteobacteria bacterium 4484_65]